MLTITIAPAAAATLRADNPASRGVRRNNRNPKDSASITPPERSGGRAFGIAMERIRAAEIKNPRAFRANKPS